MVVLSRNRRVRGVYSLDIVVPFLSIRTKQRIRKQLVHVFEAFHEGWNYEDRLKAVRPHFNAGHRKEVCTAKRDGSFPIFCGPVACRRACLCCKQGGGCQHPNPDRQADADDDGGGRWSGALSLASFDGSHRLFNPGRLLHSLPHGGNALFAGAGQCWDASRDLLHQKGAQH
jgi:hypothetical protein